MYFFRRKAIVSLYYFLQLQPFYVYNLSTTLLFTLLDLVHK